MSECNCDNKCNSKPYEIVGITQIDIDDLASTPDYFLGVRELTDESTGNTINTPVRIPGAKVMPTGNLANVVAMPTNNEALSVPEGQVLAGYIDTGASKHEMKLAGKDRPAMFLMLGAFTNGKMLIQSTGYLNIQKGHKYIIGSQYYLGENGEPVTTKDVSEQKLFMPLDDHILLVNGDF